MSSNGELTPRQQRAVAYLIECSTVEEASKKAGVSRSTMYEWLKTPIFQQEVERAKRQQFEDSLEQLRQLIPEAIKGLKELSRSSNDQVRLRACIEILKATRAYGANVATLPYSPEDSPLTVSIEYTSKLTLQILEKVLSGEMPGTIVNPLLQVLSKLEEFGEKSVPSRYRPWLEQLGEDLYLAVGDAIEDVEDRQKVLDKLHEIWELKYKRGQRFNW